jgi:chitin disaccharide deacetylase
MLPSKRYLIVNADDFGRSFGVNQGIIAAYEHGIVTSASLMVRWPAAAEAAAYGRGHPNLSLGLHFDLGEWIYRDETWLPLYEVVPTDDTAAVASQLTEQLAAFGRLVGRHPTHIDSHQHIHRWEPVHSVLIETARKLAVPLRHYSSEIRYCGDFYGQTRMGVPLPQAIGVDRLINILAALPPGITELGCHPGEANDLMSMYRDERTEELKALCDSQVRARIVAEGIELRSFHTINFQSVDPTLIYTRV